MTQEEKQLLLKDLCARLPYEVKVELTKYKQKCLLCGIDGEDLYLNIDSDPFSLGDFDIKPYLRPLSSMTEEEKEEYTSYCFEQPFLQKDNIPNLGSVPMCIDWLLAHHFDYRGLIEEGLALEAPNDMYKTE